MTDAPASPAPEPPKRRRPAYARGGLAAVGVLSLALTFLSSFQIIRATLFPSALDEVASCTVGLHALYDSMVQARNEAAAQNDGEKAALHDFRASLDKEWSKYGSVRARCIQEGNPRALETLRSVEMLRYAEERAVRYDALDLSRLRRTTPLALEALTTPTAPSK